MLATDPKYSVYVSILRTELVPAMGCTEPISVAYAAAKARDVLGCIPDTVVIGCSGSIIKNVKSVIVPNTGGLKGLEAAAAAVRPGRLLRCCLCAAGDAQLQELGQRQGGRVFRRKNGSSRQQGKAFFRNGRNKYMRLRTLGSSGSERRLKWKSLKNSASQPSP